MARMLCAAMYVFELITLATAALVKPHIYTAGSSPIASIFEVHGISTFAHGLPGHEDLSERKNVQHGNMHSQKSDLADSQGTNAPLTEPARPKRG